MVELRIKPSQWLQEQEWKFGQAIATLEDAISAGPAAVAAAERQRRALQAAAALQAAMAAVPPAAREPRYPDPYGGRCSELHLLAFVLDKDRWAGL